MKTIVRHLLMAVMAVMLLTACGSSKRATATVEGSASDQMLFGMVVNNNYKYEALQSKCRINLFGRVTLSGKMCLESGERFAISFNMPMLGFEVGRLEATADEVVIVDKYDKVYTTLSLADVTSPEAIAGHEMEALECLLLGRIFIPGHGQATTKDFGRLRWLSDADGKGTTGTFDGQSYSLAYHISAQGQLQSTTLTMADGKSVSWSYDDWKTVDKSHVVATTEAIKATSGSNDLSVNLHLTNPQLGESSWNSFNATGSYRQVTMSELVDILKNIMK